MNVRHKLCRHPNCKLVPTYGTEGTRVPVACLEHSDADMVDLKRARMRMSQSKRATTPAAERSSSTRGEVAASESGQAAAAAAAASQAVASPAIAERAAAGAGAAAAVPVPAVPTPTAAAAAPAPEAVAGKKRPRAKGTQGLGGNAGIGRKIAEAIFASSQRVLEGEEVGAAAAVAATEESEWEEDEDEASGEGNDDDDVDDDEEDEKTGAEEEEGGGREGTPGQSLPAMAGAGAVAGAEAPSEVAAALVSPLLPDVTSCPGQPPSGGRTSLSWSCVVCSKLIGSDDRHVLVCCGYGLLHKTCTSAFVGRAAPCPKCSRLVGSSLQVFV